ncbi:MAG TPA: cytochrome c [Thermoanaerobaculia bacterium]|nr:cytochrome c [Thermoanaerobaculia bacterium]
MPSWRPVLSWKVGGLLACLLVTGGCVRGCASSRPPIHLNPNMDDQPRMAAFKPNDFFADGSAMRQPIPGTVAVGDAVAPGPLETGRVAPGADAAFVATIPAAAREPFGTAGFLARGEERYGIFCAPCHGDRGDGRGMLFHRSGVNSADLRLARLHAVPDGQLYDVITHGLGLMPSYAAQVPVADRWAIVGWVRHLQAESEVVPDPGAAAGGETPTTLTPTPEAPSTATPAVEGDPTTVETPSGGEPSQSERGQTEQNQPAAGGSEEAG